MSPLPVDLGDGAILRRLVLADLEEVWAVVDRERERLGPWMPWVPRTQTIEQQRTWLASVAANQRSLEGCGLFVDERYVGGVGLTPDASTASRPRSGTGSRPRTRVAAWSRERSGR